MKHHFSHEAVVICDEYKSVVGVNKNAINFGITLNVVGQSMDEKLFEQLVDEKKEKVTLSAGQ